VQVARILHIFCDGSITGGVWGKRSGPRTVPHGWSGWVVKRPDGIVVAHHSIDLGEAEYMTGNVAEYMALRSVLKWCLDNHPLFSLVVHSDSQLLVCQMDGTYETYKPHLLRLRDDCRALATTFPTVRYKWIRREENLEADTLSKALQTWGYVPTWEEVKKVLR
jgi:ribonuclease HI